MPSCSSARSRSDSVRGLIPLHECSSSENRRAPSERSWTRIAVHFAPTISAQAATEHDVESCTGFIVRMYRILVRCPERSRRCLELRDREAGDRPESWRRLAGLRDPRVAGDGEEDERILDGEAMLVPSRLLRRLFARAMLTNRKRPVKHTFCLP